MNRCDLHVLWLAWPFHSKCSGFLNFWCCIRVLQNNHIAHLQAQNPLHKIFNLLYVTFNFGSWKHTWSMLLLFGHCHLCIPCMSLCHYTTTDMRILSARSHWILMCISHTHLSMESIFLFPVSWREHNIESINTMHGFHFSCVWLFLLTNQWLILLAQWSSCKQTSPSCHV